MNIYDLYERRVNGEELTSDELKMLQIAIEMREIPKEKDKRRHRNFMISACLTILTFGGLAGLEFKLGRDYLNKHPEVRTAISPTQERREYFNNIDSLEYQAQYFLDHAAQLRISGYNEEEVESYISKARQQYITALELSRGEFEYPLIIKRLEDSLKSLDGWSKK